MEASPEYQLEQLLADFTERYGAMARARAQLTTLSVTAQSRDGIVEATVAVNGSVPTIRFVDKRFRDMQGSVLANDVLEALATARAEAILRIDVLRTYAQPQLPARVTSRIDTGSSARDGVPRCGVRDQRPGVRGRLPGAHFHE
ncbi:YbaB/EbfC family nucleoid-associated protein [Streptomyces sp. NPDC006333]|uniref:YbaB/EbfC family nucleoid-associated protein n=1 Tax=Streptomyces sp. NPDC006333 TaxID=3156753 RepID=UPI0033BA0E01